MSVKANKISLKQEGGSMIQDGPGMINTPQQPQVDPKVMQITQLIKQGVDEGKDLVMIIKNLMSQELEQELIGQALMMGGMEQEDIVTIFETVNAPPEPSSPQEVDRDPQLLARNKDIAKREREAAANAQSQEQEVDISEQVRTMAKSGIEIKPENEGKFTAWAKKRGMGVQEAARKVLANKGKYPPSVVKMANFARNAAKWKKEEGGEQEEFKPHFMYKGDRKIKANDMATHLRLKDAGYGHDAPKAQNGTETGQYINGVFIPDESNMDKNTLANNLKRPKNEYMSNQNYSVAPLMPPPSTNILADFINTASTINNELFSNELDDYGNRKGAFLDINKRGEGISINNPFKKGKKIQITQGNPDPDAGSGMSKMEMHKALKPLYYNVEVDTSKMTSPENQQAYADWAVQQAKEWDMDKQRQLDEQAEVISDVSGVPIEEDKRTFSQWAQDAGHDISTMSENAVNLLQNLWKRTTGKMKKGGGVNNSGFKALPPEAQHNILSNMSLGGDKASKKDVKDYSKTWGTNKRDTKNILHTLIQEGANLDTDTIISNYHPSMDMGDMGNDQRMYNLATNVNASNLLPYMHSSSANFQGELSSKFPFVDAYGYGSYLAVPKKEKGGEDSYLANRDRVIKRAIARQEGKAQTGGAPPFVGPPTLEEQQADQIFGPDGVVVNNTPMGPFEDKSPYLTYPYITELDFDNEAKDPMFNYDDGDLMTEDQIVDRDGDKIPDTVDVDGGDGTGRARLGTINNPSADMLFENVVTTPDFNVTNKLEGTLDRINDNPNFRAFTSGSKSLVDAAGFVNRIFDKRAYNDALDQMEERSGADYKYGVTTSDPFSEGFYDANSGQLQGEAERTPGYYMNFASSPNMYGQDGVETKSGLFTPDKKQTSKKEFDYSNMSPEQIMYIQQFLDKESNTPTNMQLFPKDSAYINRPVLDRQFGMQTFTMPPKETGGEIVELSQDMIAQLIAAGADIEII